MLISASCFRKRFRWPILSSSDESDFRTQARDYYWFYYVFWLHDALIFHFNCLNYFTHTHAHTGHYVFQRVSVNVQMEFRPIQNANRPISRWNRTDENYY